MNYTIPMIILSCFVVGLTVLVIHDEIKLQTITEIVIQQQEHVRALTEYTTKMDDELAKDAKSNGMVDDLVIKTLLKQIDRLDAKVNSLK